MTMQKLPFVLMRGGTSKGVFLRADLMPEKRDELTHLILDIFGSPDRRQIDGLGGADKLTSKVAIIGRSNHNRADVTYLFGQVGMDHAEVDYNLNCGNLSAAVGLYALQERLAIPTDEIAHVRIHNLNTDRIITASVQVSHGIPQTRGDCRIDGVPGTGSPIELDFSQATGAITGTLFPLGGPCSSLDIPDLGSIPVSVVDGANLVVYVTADSIGIKGTEMPQEINANPTLCARLTAIRKAAAYACGLREYWENAKAPSTPIMVILQKPSNYTSYSGKQAVFAKDLHLTCRQFASGSATKTLAATVTATTGMAARIPNTLVHDMTGNAAPEHETLALGHPSGIIHVRSSVRSGNSGHHVEQSSIIRTARRIAEGYTYLH